MFRIQINEDRFFIKNVCGSGIDRRRMGNKVVTVAWTPKSFDCEEAIESFAERLWIPACDTNYGSYHGHEYFFVLINSERNFVGTDTCALAIPDVSSCSFESPRKGGYWNLKPRARNSLPIVTSSFTSTMNTSRCSFPSLDEEINFVIIERFPRPWVRKKIFSYARLDPARRCRSQAMRTQIAPPKHIGMSREWCTRK